MHDQNYQQEYYPVMEDGEITVDQDTETNAHPFQVSMYDLKGMLEW